MADDRTAVVGGADEAGAPKSLLNPDLVSIGSALSFAKQAGLPQGKSNRLGVGSDDLRWTRYHLKVMLGRGTSIGMESYSITFRPLSIEWSGWLRRTVAGHYRLRDQFPLMREKAGVRLSREWKTPNGGIGKEELMWDDEFDGGSRIVWRISADEAVNPLPTILDLKEQLPWFYKQSPACLRASRKKLPELLELKIVAEAFARKNGHAHLLLFSGYGISNHAEEFGPEHVVRTVSETSRVGLTIIGPRNKNEVLKVVSRTDSALPHLRFLVEVAYEPTDQLPDIDAASYRAIINGFGMKD